MSTITINVSQSTLPINFFTASARWIQSDTERSAEEMNFHQILFILDGKGTLYFNGEEYPLSKGCAFYIAKGVAYRHTDDGGLISAFFSLKGDGLVQVCESYTENGFLFRKNVDVDYWVSRIENYISTYNRFASAGKLSSLAYEFYLDFFEESEKGKSTSLDKILSHIEKTFRENQSLEDIARVGGVSVSTLCHSFKKAYAKTVMEYIVSLRLEWARGYIVANPSCLVKDVAKLSGFEDVSYFCRAFKKKYGSSPSRGRIY